MREKSNTEVTDDFLAKYGHTRESYEKLSRAGKWSVRNRERHYKACKETVAKNKEYYSKRHRKYQLSKNYGITEDDYNNMLKSQNYCCAICGTDTPTGKWKVFAVDHDHTTGKVRSLLCNECNRGIGLLKDSPDLLMKAATYLIGHNVKTQNEKNGNLQR